MQCFKMKAEMQDVPLSKTFVVVTAHACQINLDFGSVDILRRAWENWSTRRKTLKTNN